MDLAALVGNRPLLAQLSAEYEALKTRSAAQGGDAAQAVDYEAWIRCRLREAAAAIVAEARAGVGGDRNGGSGGDGSSLLEALQRRQQQACAQRRLAYRTQLRQRQRVEAAVASLATGEVDAIGGCGWLASDVTNSLEQNVAGGSKRPPDWVAAAHLQAALNGGGRAVPAMQAAADRERRLALAAAVAAQDAVIHTAKAQQPPQAKARAKRRPPGSLAAAEEEDGSSNGAPSTFLTLHLAAQAQALRKVVEQQGEQVKRQEAMLQQLLAAGPATAAARPAQALDASPAGAAPSAEAAAAPQGAQQQREAAEVAPQSPPLLQQLPAAAQGSWLVQSVVGGARGQQAVAGQQLQPEQAPTQQQPVQSPPAVSAVDSDKEARKAALKTALRQLLLGERQVGAVIGGRGATAALLAQLVTSLLVGGSGGVVPAPAPSSQQRPEPQQQWEQQQGRRQQAWAQAQPAAAARAGGQIPPRSRSDPGPPPPTNARKLQEWWAEDLRQQGVTRGARTKPAWDDRPSQPLPRHQERRRESMGAASAAPSLRAPSPFLQQAAAAARRPLAKGRGVGAAAGVPKRRVSAPAGPGLRRADAARDVERRVAVQLEEEEIQERLQRLEALEARAREVISGLEGGGSRGPHHPAETGATAAEDEAAAGSGLPVQALRAALASLDRVGALEEELARRWLSGDGDECGGWADTVAAGQPLEGAHHQAPQQQEPQQEPQQQRAPSPPAQEVISDSALRSILAGRRRFLRHQAELDGLPAPSAAGAAAPPALLPTQVVEVVADALLDEAIEAVAWEMEEACDGICDALFAEEFC